MPDLPISGLTEITQNTYDTEIPVVKDGITKRISTFNFLKGAVAHLEIAPSGSEFSYKANYRPDGVSDEDEFQDAFDEINANPLGGDLFIRDGNYTTDASIFMRSKVRAWATGWGAVIGGSGTTAYSIFSYENTDANNPITDFQLLNLKIDGSGVNPAVYSTSTKGVFAKFMKRCYFQKLYVKDTGASGLGVDFLVDSWITDCLIENAGRLVVDPDTDQGGSGIGIGTGGYTVENLVVAHNTARDCGKYGIFFEAQNSTVNAKKMFCHSNYSYNNRYGLGNRGVSDIDFSNNWSWSNDVHGFFSDTSPFSSFTPDNMNLYGNKFISNGDRGVKIQGTHANTTVENNVFRGNSGGPADISASSTLIMRNNPGLNPISGGVGSVSPGGSPYTYTAGSTPETLYIRGGTVSDVSKSSTTIFTATNCTVILEPNQTVVITYSSTPTLIRERR